MLITTFIGTGHINTEKMLSIYRETGRYTIALHEFLRAVIYGDRVFYDPGVSPVANLFDVSTSDRREHFLAPIIAHLVQRVPVTRDIDYGYLNESEVYEHCQALNVLPQQIGSSIRRMERHGVVEYEELPRLSDPEPPRLRITRAGGYTIQRLIGMFAYVDAVIVDTPIINDDVRQSIGDAVSLPERLDRTRKFRRYLDRSWDDLGGASDVFDWTIYTEKLGAEIEHIQSRITE